MPAREVSALFDVPVALTGSGVGAATQTSLGNMAGGAQLPRCPASLLLCEQGPHWACRACKRSYRQLPAEVAAGVAANTEGAAMPTPACIFCALPLGPAAPCVLLSPPCCF
jgi:hypothetical protein